MTRYPRLAAAALAAVFVLSACKPTAQAPAASSASAAFASVPAPSTPPAAPLITGLPDFTPLVEKVGPSVVNIRTTERVGRRGSSSAAEQQMEELLRRFFGTPDAGRSQRGGGEQERTAGVGSGFVISSDGYIMTNAHVVDGAASVIVTTSDKREFTAKVVGADTRTDVAVLKVEAQDLRPVHIGNAALVKAGQWVMAIGSPFGLENSVTAGIVSAMQRDTGDYLSFIQTDVAINPGNSGGPLINMAGEVVGINSQIYSRSGGFMGISFAIPIDDAMRVAEQLRTTGKVERSRIGVQIAPVDAQTASSLGIAKERGALVRDVERGSPADQAGMVAGDVIVQFNGTAIERVSDLPRLVGSTKPGTTVPLIVLRRGKEQALTITVEQAQDEVPSSQQR